MVPAADGGHRDDAREPASLFVPVTPVGAPHDCTRPLPTPGPEAMRTAVIRAVGTPHGGTRPSGPPSDPPTVAIRGLPRLRVDGPQTLVPAEEPTGRIATIPADPLVVDRPACATPTDEADTAGSDPEPATPAGVPRSLPRPADQRLLGVDAARGVALVGILALQALAWTDDAAASASAPLITADHVLALLALVSGVALTVSTGRDRLVAGRGVRAHVGAASVRAGLLLLLGLGIGWTDPQVVGALLPPYAVLLLLGAALLLLPTGLLIGVAVALAAGVPALTGWARIALPAPTLPGPRLLDVVSDPGGLLVELTLTGPYPAVGWLPCLALGIVVGRLVPDSTGTAATLLGAGVAVAVVSHLLGDPLHGHPLDPARTGVAMAVLGAALLLAAVHRSPAVPRIVTRPLGWLLWPLGAVGSMTLSLVAAALLFAGSPLDVVDPLTGLFWQIGGAVVLATAWRRVIGRGPLEGAASMLADTARDLLRGDARVTSSRP